MRTSASYILPIVVILQVVQFARPAVFVPVLLAFGGSAILTGFYTFRCQFSTCCDDTSIIRNISGLKLDLEEKLHGQHLVKRAVIGHIKGHVYSKKPQKALVLSFHGLTGVGKNFVSGIIADNLYKDGLRSPFVHMISATKEFPHQGMVSFYKSQLKSWIEGNVTKCERSMFIFDEVDKLPAELLDVLKPYADYYEHLKGVSYNRVIFILLSNTGGNDVSKVLFQQWRNGEEREKLQLSEVERIVMSAAINADDKNGLWHSHLISSQLVTAYIPFLPLEKHHVRKCIKDALVSMRYFSFAQDIDETLVDEVMKELVFFPEEEQVYSSTGCKRVAEKVHYVMFDKNPHDFSKKRKRNSEL